ncbi:hypothetical protein RclHR1_06290008 [Rhizophagus clarus]|uniref:Uncharacterized protein n=1 Tax=Rhizophagus clarus TaxID=94130 RepID=A0A2Z6RXD7_9GLOM|nr:hypothetical protein RclHR1_06290008 [Rhizophagus clarus]GES83254.1 hypothetical protein GLOIN_2v274129 [Rhizophagus clarus]
MSKFILITLFLTLTLAWVTQSIPAMNYLEHCSDATESTKEFVYFPSEFSNRKLNGCNYCGGFYPQCCANLCGVLGYKYYQCLECQCGCGN